MTSFHEDGQVPSDIAPVDGDDLSELSRSVGGPVTRDQAKVFYTGIISGIDPTISLKVGYQS